MRALAPALAAVAGVTAVVGVASAGARPAAPALVASCGKTSLVVLFWPHGHRAIPPIGFAASPAAHVELYRFAAAQTYRPRNFLGSLAASGRPVLRCRGAGDGPRGVRPLRPWRRRATKAAISCAFVGAPTVQLAPIGGLWRLRLVERGTGLVLDAALSPIGGSTVAFTPSRCRAGPAPA